MKICSNCKTQCSDDAAFCNKCGAPIVNNQNNTYNNALHKESIVDKIINFFTKTPDYTSEFDANDISESKGLCACSYLAILFFIPLVAKPNSRYSKFHSNQGLVLFIIDIVLGIAAGLITKIISSFFTVEETLFGIGTGYYTTSGLGLFLCSIVNIIVYVPIITFIVLGIVNAVNGKVKELPIIGKIKIINY